MKRWPTKPLEEIAELYGGSTPSRDSPVFWGGDIYWVTPTDLPMPDEGISVVSKTKDRITQAGLDNSSATVVPKGTVLFSSRATIGKVAVADMPLTTNQGFANFVPHSEVTSRFLAYALWFHREDIARLSGSTTFKEVSRSTLRKYHLPVPPLAEQERIVKLLDEADELRKLRVQADRRTTALIPALFHEMFGGSRGWPVERLEKLCERITVGHVGPMATEYCETGVPFLRGQNIKRGFIDLSAVLFVSEDFHRCLAKSAIEPGDVVSVRTGKPGTTAVVPPSLKVANCADLIVITCGLRLIPGFLCELLNQRLGDKDTIAGATGIAQQHFNIGEARRLEIAVPPLPLQNEFTARVSDIRALQTGQAASRRRLEDLFHSLLHRAFRGEL